MIADTFAGLFGTLLAALVIFLLKENVFVIRKLSGVFYLKSTTEASKWGGYPGLQTFHTLVIFSDGITIEGTSEKTGDIDPDGTHRPYTGAHRSRGKVSGKVERNYLKPSKLYLHIEETGGRLYSIHMSFKITRKLILDGHFHSTAADSAGITLWFDKPLPEHPTRS